MIPSTFTQTEQAVIVTERLTDTQATAVDLYRRGFNVFPLPSAWEWRARPGYKDDPNKKPPYLAESLFTSRLHLCAPDCRHVLPYEFTALFERVNIGVMMGRTSGNLLAIDCDSFAAFETIGAGLTRQALPFWAITSHRGGAYLLRLAEGEAANLPEAKIKDVQVWGNRHYIVIPPSVHPQGTMYQWHTPEPRYCLPPGASIPPVSVTALDWLGVTLKRGKWQEPDLFGLPEWAAVLSYRNRQTLAHGATEGQRNARLTAAAYDLAGCEIPYEISETVILQAAERCTPEYPQRDALAILRSAYKKPNVTPARESDRPTAKTWQRAATFAASFDWRMTYGRKANSRRSVFLACVKRAEMDGRAVFRASGREIADLLGKSYGKYITDKLKALCSDGLLVNAGKAQCEANLYRFGDAVLDYSEYSPLYTPCSISGDFSDYQKTPLPNTDAAKDTFTRLGITAWQVWQYLLTEPTRTGYAIAKAANLPKSSTYAALRRLQGNGLVTYSMAEGLYYGEPVTSSTLEVLAVELGTSGTSEQRKATHRIEREIRANWKMARAREKWNYEHKKEA